MGNCTIQRELPWSWHRTPGWRGHLARLVRWRDRLKDANCPADVEDYLYAFFQNCYHMRDWLPETTFPSTEVEAFLDQHFELRVCRDICNMTKHCELTRRPAQGLELCVLREYVGAGNGWFEDDSRLIIATQNIVLDARDVASCCLRLWRGFLHAADNK